MDKKTLYVHRPLLNGAEFVKWAKEQGFKKVLDSDDLHVTIAFSKKEVDWDEIAFSKTTMRNNSVKNRKVVPLGNEGAVVLKFESEYLHGRWKYFMERGCSWDWDSYQSHVSITYSGSDVDLSKVKPFTGMLKFGPEKAEELDLDWKNKVKEE